MGGAVAPSGGMRGVSPIGGCRGVAPRVGLGEGLAPPRVRSGVSCIYHTSRKGIYPVKAPVVAWSLRTPLMRSLAQTIL